MRDLRKFQAKVVTLALAVSGVIGAANIVSAKPEPVPNDFQGNYFQGSPRCESNYNEHEHPVLCAALADLYRIRLALDHGDEQRKEAENRNDQAEKRDDQISYQHRMKAIQAIDRAIAETKEAIWSDRK